MRTLLCVLWCCLCTVTVSGLAAATSFDPTIESITTTVTGQVVSWHLDWTGHPDLRHTDGFNRQVDSFQLYTWAVPVPVGGSAGPYEAWGSVIRGEEIHEWGALAVRAILPIDPDVRVSGGWGTLRELDAFKLSGKTLTFQTTLAALGVPTSNFGYGMETFHEGAQNNWYYNCASGGVCGLPEPSSVLLMAVGLAGLVLVHRANIWRS